MHVQIKREIRILKHLRHPNVVDLKQVMASKTKIYMVMELVAGGELFDKVVGDGPMPVSGAWVWAAYRLACAVAAHQLVAGGGLVGRRVRRVRGPCR